MIVAGASKDTGLAQETRHLTVPAQEVADQRDKMVIENLQAIFGSGERASTSSHPEALGREPYSRQGAFQYPEQEHRWNQDAAS